MPQIANYETPGTPFQFYDFAEGDGGPQLAAAAGGSRLERRVQIAPGYLGLARRVFVGYSRLGVTAGLRPYVQRLPPHGYEDEQHLDPNGKPWLWGVSVERTGALNVSSQSAISGAPRGLLDTATVVYRSLTYDVRADADPAVRFQPESGQLNPLSGYPDEASLNRYVTRRYKMQPRIVTLPRAIPQWVLESGDTGYTGSVAGPPVFEALGRSENAIEVSYTWHEVPNVSAASGGRPEPCVGLGTIGKALNTVNKYTFDGIYEPGTLLLRAANIEEDRNVRGERVFNVTYVMLYNPKYDRASPPVARGHNAYLRAVPRTSASEKTWLDYRTVTLTGLSTGQKTYPEFDFADLFRPESP